MHDDDDVIIRDIEDDDDDDGETTRIGFGDDDDEPVEASAEPVEADEKKEDDPEDEPAPDPAEQGEDKSSQLEPELLEKLKDLPEVKELIESKLAALDSDREALDKERADWEQRNEVIVSYDRAFANPETWRDAYLALGSELAKAYGVDPRSIGGSMLATPQRQEHFFAPGVNELLPAVTATGYEREMYERLGWVSENEMHLAKQTAAIKAESEAKIAELQRQVQELAKGTSQKDAESKKQAELSDMVAREITSVRKHFERMHPRFNVTENMLKTGLTRFPNHPPAKAVELAYSEAIRNHAVKEASKRSQRGPDMLDSGKPRGTRQVSAENYSGRDALREIRSQQGS